MQRVLRSPKILFISIIHYINLLSYFFIMSFIMGFKYENKNLNSQFNFKFQFKISKFQILQLSNYSIIPISISNIQYTLFQIPIFQYFFIPKSNSNSNIQLFQYFFFNTIIFFSIIIIIIKGVMYILISFQ